MKIGYLPCRTCGNETNCADLVSGLCPSCAQKHVAYLADLQRQYDKALSAGDVAASGEVAAIISAYEKSERVRLNAARHDRHKLAG